MRLKQNLSKQKGAVFGNDNMVPNSHVKAMSKTLMVQSKANVIEKPEFEPKVNEAE